MGQCRNDNFFVGMGMRGRLKSALDDLVVSGLIAFPGKLALPKVFSKLLQRDH
jgi:hypothetical protein